MFPAFRTSAILMLPHGEEVVDGQRESNGRVGWKTTRSYRLWKAIGSRSIRDGSVFVRQEQPHCEGSSQPFGKLRTLPSQGSGYKVLILRSAEYQYWVVTLLSVAASFCSGGIARSAAKPLDLAIQGERGQHR